MIYQNGKEITPKLNGVDLSRVMHNGNKIYPALNRFTFIMTCTNENPQDIMAFLEIDKSSYQIYLDTPIVYEYPASSETHTFSIYQNYTATDKVLKIDGVDISNYLNGTGSNDYTWSCETDHVVEFSYNERGMPTP